MKIAKKSTKPTAHKSTQSATPAVPHDRKSEIDGTMLKALHDRGVEGVMAHQLIAVMDSLVWPASA